MSTGATGTTYAVARRGHRVAHPRVRDRVELRGLVDGRDRPVRRRAAAGPGEPGRTAAHRRREGRLDARRRPPATGRAPRPTRIAGGAASARPARTSRARPARLSRSAATTSARRSALSSRRPARAARTRRARRRPTRSPPPGSRRSSPLRAGSPALSRRPVAGGIFTARIAVARNDGAADHRRHGAVRREGGPLAAPRARALLREGHRHLHLGAAPLDERAAHRGHRAGDRVRPPGGARVLRAGSLRLEAKSRRRWGRPRPSRASRPPAARSSATCRGRA